MAGRDRRLDRALHRTRELRDATARDILLARQQSGLSQDDAGRSVAMSGSQFGRIERGELRHVTLEQLARASAVVGLRPTLRLYPDGDPVRDVAQTRLLERLRARVPPTVGWRTEVPVRGANDPRSWDAQLWFSDARDGVEAETRIVDGQATWRRCAMKVRDDPTVDHVVLLIADTPPNRRALLSIRALLRPELPLDSRAVLAKLEAGRSPGANGIRFL